MTFIELLKYFKDNQIVPKIVDDSVQLVGNSELITDELLLETKSKESRILSFLQQGAQQIKSVEKRQYYPATSAQRRLYFLQKLNDSSCAYNVSLVIPNIDIEDIREVIGRLIKRHEALRTSFFVTGETLYQRVWDDVDIQIEEGPVADNKAFDLNMPPLMRVTYNRGSYLHLTFHHIITDGVSQGIIQRDITDMITGNMLKPLRLQYKDYADWFQTGARPLLRREEAYWLSQFTDGIPVSALPLDFKRPGIQHYEGTTVDFYLTADEMAQSARVGKECGLTAYMTMLAVMFMLTAKISGQTDIVIGTFVTGRRHAGLESMIGMFVNTLPLRCELSGAHTLRHFLQAVKQKSLDALDHQDYPFEDLVDKLLSKREAGRNPLFDVAFSMSRGHEPVEQGMIDEDGFTVTHGVNAKFDLTFSVLDLGKQMIVSVNYADSLFKLETVKSFIGVFRSIIADLSARLDEPVMAADAVQREKKNNDSLTIPHVPESAPVAAHDPLEEQLKEIWSQVLKIPKEEIHRDSNAFELGAHSLKLLNIYTLMKKKLGATVPLMYLYQHPTIAAARDMLVNKMFFFSPVNHFNNAASKTIFSFPPIIGVSYCYRGIAKHLEDYRISCFNYYKTDDLVKSYADKIVEIQGQPPYVLLGYSIGGLLLYPVAKELESRGLRVSKIITMDGYWDPYPGIKNPDLIYSLFDRFSTDYNVDVLRQEFYDVVFEYDAFLKEIRYNTRINADIHFIISQGYEQVEPAQVIDKEIERIKTRMGSFTTRKCTVYKGYGIHNTMLDDEAGPKNAAILKAILSA